MFNLSLIPRCYNPFLCAGFSSLHPSSQLRLVSLYVDTVTRIQDLSLVYKMVKQPKLCLAGRCYDTVTRIPDLSLVYKMVKQPKLCLAGRCYDTAVLTDSKCTHR